jgi:hypothetical protein
LRLALGPILVIVLKVQSIGVVMPPQLKIVVLLVIANKQYGLKKKIEKQ